MNKGQEGRIVFCTGDQELTDRFKAYCKSRGMSITFVLTNCVKKILEDEENKNNTKQGSLIKF